MSINFKSFNYRPILVSLAIIACFTTLVLVYFSPVFEGKELRQHDVLQYLGTAEESFQYEKSTGETPLWTNSLFSGMPTYLIHISTKNLVGTIYNMFHTTVQHPEMIVLMYFIWAFLALLLVNIPMGLAALGGLFYGLSTYFYIIIEAGHITKAISLGYMPLIIASTYAAFWQKRKIFASAIFTMALALQLIANHLQITYYTALICLVLVCFALYKAIKEKTIKENFVKPSLYLLVGLILAVGADFSRIYAAYDYGMDSIRGKSELTDHSNIQTQGLDKDYATAWSYGIDETLDLFIPNFMGGASSGELDTDSEVYKTLKQNGVPNTNKIIKNMPTYWGDQPITSGPVYIGAIVIFLFIFGLLYVTGPVKWWLVIVTILSITLAWGHNFMPLTDLFLDYFPGYNKFRTVSMILIIAEFAMPLLGILALKRFFEAEDKTIAFKKLGIALGISGGLLLFLIFTSGIWSFQGPHDAELLPDWLLPALQADRKAMMLSDSWRSLLIVIVSFVILTLFHFGKMKQNVAIVLLAAVVVVDMYPVNKRYLNAEDFKKPTKLLFQPTRADKMILKDSDPNFRVMNLTVSPFNDASTSYFHKSIGGYHGAKLKRYQELIDSCLARQNWDVYNMLNTKYFIVNGKDNYPIAQPNPEALGNAWFVKNIHKVPNADAEIVALKDFNPSVEAFVDQRFEISDTEYSVDSAATIKLESYSPIELTYTSTNSQKGAAIFSEIYYAKGWNAYIDGEPTPHFRANYVLRGLEIPAGTHTISFKFEPTLFQKTDQVSLVFSILLLIGFFGICGFEIYRNVKSSPEIA
ncbi:MAG: YfhO family protein [Bacteroidales bacterium]|nr:YfhO family protein [Bacteroidales bacterium]